MGWVAFGLFVRGHWEPWGGVRIVGDPWRPATVWGALGVFTGGIEMIWGDVGVFRRTLGWVAIGWVGGTLGWWDVGWVGWLVGRWPLGWARWVG